MKRPLIYILLVGAFFHATLASSQQAAAEDPASWSASPRPNGRRVIVYYQHHWPLQDPNIPPSQWGDYVSPLPLIGSATHVMLAAVHLNDINGPIPVITLNDNPPDDPIYTRLWADIATLRQSGVKVLAMLGGAQPNGTFRHLSLVDGSFDEYYPLLRGFLRKYNFDGIDLDCEDGQTYLPYTLNDMVHLIKTIRQDFGPEYLITQAPVARALDTAFPNDVEDGGISGFNYFDLETQIGDQISWYNAQFYEGWGVFDSDEGISAYERIAARLTAPRTVAIILSNKENGKDYVDVEEVANSVLPQLVRAYSNKAYESGFGGIASWEYFNSMPGGLEKPWKWAVIMKDAMTEALQASI